MSIFSGRNPDAQWGKCERCGHPIIIRKEGQKYGRVCAKSRGGIGMTKNTWQPGYVPCAADPCTGGHRENAFRNCTQCTLCGAQPGEVGIGCLQCEMCLGDPDAVI